MEEHLLPRSLKGQAPIDHDVALLVLGGALDGVERGAAPCGAQLGFVNLAPNPQKGGAKRALGPSARRIGPLMHVRFSQLAHRIWGLHPTFDGSDHVLIQDDGILIV
eukprot:7722848-Pyramimonas_sp.AAC.2